MVDPAFRQIIAQFRRSRSWDDELDLRLLQALWPTMAGPSVARAVSVIDVRGDEVVLRVPDRTWHRQLVSMRPLLVRRFNESWPGQPIRHIRFAYEDYAH